MEEIKLIKQETVLEKEFKIYGNFENPLFLAKDVAEWVDYDSNKVGQMLKTVDEDEKLTTTIYRSGQKREMWFLTEEGLYEVLMQSRKPIAKAFKKEVKKILKSVRTGQATIIDSNKLNEIEVQAKQDRAKAMLLNAQNRALKTIMGTVNNKGLSAVALEVFGLKAIEQLMGADMSQLLPKTGTLYSATELGEMFGISAQKIGTIANANNLKTNEYGIFVLDKSRYSSKEVSSFRYNKKGVAKLKEIIGVN